MPPFVRLSFDPEALIDGLYEFVTEPRPAVRNALPIADEARDSAHFPVSFEVMETMVLDGVEDRADVADLVHYVTVSSLP